MMTARSAESAVTDPLDLPAWHATRCVMARVARAASECDGGGMAIAAALADWVHVVPEVNLEARDLDLGWLWQTGRSLRRRCGVQGEPAFDELERVLRSAARRSAYLVARLTRRPVPPAGERKAALSVQYHALVALRNVCLGPQPPADAHPYSAFGAWVLLADVVLRVLNDARVDVDALLRGADPAHAEVVRVLLGLDVGT